MKISIYLIWCQVVISSFPTAISTCTLLLLQYIVTMSARAYGWRYQKGSRARLSRQFSQHLYINYHFNNIQNKRILGRLWVMLNVEYHTMTMKCTTAIHSLFHYFNLCLSVILDRLSWSFTSISFLTNCSRSKTV